MRRRCWINGRSLNAPNCRNRSRQTRTSDSSKNLRSSWGKMTHRPKNPAVANGYVIPEYQRELFLRWHQQKHIRKQFRSASEFSMAVLTGKIQAELSNPAKHYNWRHDEP